MHDQLIINKIRGNAAKKEHLGKKAFSSAAPETLTLYKIYSEQIRQITELLRRDCKYGGVYVDFRSLKVILESLKYVKPTNAEERKELKSAIEGLLGAAKELKIPIVVENPVREVGFGGTTKMVKENLGKKLEKLIPALGA